MVDDEIRRDGSVHTGRDIDGQQRGRQIGARSSVGGLGARPLLPPGSRVRPGHEVVGPRPVPLGRAVPLRSTESFTDVPRPP